MKSAVVVWGGISAAALIGAAGVSWIYSLPPQAMQTPGFPAIAEQEIRATVDALKPPKRQRPLIAVIAINDATETTDYLLPYGVLRRADVADVTLLAMESRPVTLYPALTVQPHGTASEFDAQHPDGADYVIVPAMSRDDDQPALDWIRSQAEKGATIVGICAGAKVVAEAGLLDGKRATTHWYYLAELRSEHPVNYVMNRRLVADHGVATTTGITASMPMSLMLIEAIAGRDKADSVGRELGVSQWDARHDSGAFRLTRPFALTVMGNTIAFWKRERLGLALTPGIDEVSLALVADAWSRTYRSRAVTFSPTADPLQTRNGVRILPDDVAASWPAPDRVPTSTDRQPARALADALGGIAERYGVRTAEVVAMQMEYPHSPASR